MIARATTGRHVDRLLVGLTSGAAGAGGETRQIEWVEDLTGGETDAEVAAAKLRGIIAEADSLKHRAGVKRSGRKLQRPGLHVELRWPLEDRPSGDHAMEATRDALACLGFVLEQRAEPDLGALPLELPPDQAAHPVGGPERDGAGAQRAVAALAGDVDLLDQAQLAAVRRRLAGGPIEGAADALEVARQLPGRVPGALLLGAQAAVCLPQGIRALAGAGQRAAEARRALAGGLERAADGGADGRANDDPDLQGVKRHVLHSRLCAPSAGFCTPSGCSSSP